MAEKRMDETPSMWQRIADRIPDRIVDGFQEHVRPYLPDVSFITLHYLYFITTCLVTSVIFWGSSTPGFSVRYIDSLFFTVSAMTEAGLNTVNLSTLNTWQQIMLFLLIMMGSAIFVSSAILHIRKATFERRLEDLVKARHERQHRVGRVLSFPLSRSRRRASSGAGHEAAIASGAVRGRAMYDHVDEPAHSKLPDRMTDGEEQTSQHRSDADGAIATSPSGRSDHGSHIRFSTHTARERRGSLPASPTIRRAPSKLFTGGGVGVRDLENHPRNARPLYWPDKDDEPVRTAASTGLDQYFKTAHGVIGRNSQFHNLTEKERKKLGGIEYEAVSLLSWVVPTYFVLWQLLGAVGVGAWMQNDAGVASACYQNGLNPFWTGAFFAISAFNNSGMALVDANAVILNESFYCMLTLSLLILAGNTCFPPFLRLILWTMRTCIPPSWQSPRWQKRRRILSFILEHPRRVYTNLFPSAQTWWLVLSLVILNGIDWIAFEVLNIGNPAVEATPARYRWMDGLFQAFAVRSGGFYVVGIANLYPGLLVLYVLMMYVSAMPVTMTIRNTNVYEERSLGIFAEDNPEALQQEAAAKGSHGVLQGIRRRMTGDTKRNTARWTRRDFLRQQLHGQLGHDLWMLALAVLFITIIETGSALSEPTAFATFNIIFEGESLVSAYGTVGISTGVPWAAYSFSGAWHSLSKLILCVVMLRGRHRGLPVAIDRAVLLPDETLAWAEEEDALKRRASRTYTDMDLGMDASTVQHDKDGARMV